MADEDAVNATLDAYFAHYETRVGRSVATIYDSPTDMSYARTVALVAGEVIAVEGVPAVGKTTLVNSLAAALRSVGANVQALQEERDDLLLAGFFKNKQEQAFPFQMYKLARRQQLCTDLAARRQLPQHKGRTTWILDRTLPGDMAFALAHHVAGYMDVPQTDVYMQQATRIRQPAPLVVLFPSASPERLVARVRQRGNADEIAAYDIPYYQRMIACNRRALALTGCSTVVEVDWEEDLPTLVNSPPGTLLPATYCLDMLEGALVKLYGDNLERLVAAR